MMFTEQAMLQVINERDQARERIATLERELAEANEYAIASQSLHERALKAKADGWEKACGEANALAGKVALENRDLKRELAYARAVREAEGRAPGGMHRRQSVQHVRGGEGGAVSDLSTLAGVNTELEDHLELLAGYTPAGVNESDLSLVLAVVVRKHLRALVALGNEIWLRSVDHQRSRFTELKTRALEVTGG